MCWLVGRLAGWLARSLACFIVCLFVSPLHNFSLYDVRINPKTKIQVVFRVLHSYKEIRGRYIISARGLSCHMYITSISM